MAQNSWPFENADTTEAQYSRLFSALAENGVISGLVTTVSSGLNISVSAGAGLVQGFFYENTASVPLAVATANATQARKDYVVLRLDLVANSILLAVKTGTTSALGTLPTLEQTTTKWEHPIAEITVLANATNLTVDNVITRLAGTGLRIVPYDDADARAKVSTAGVSRMLGLNLSTKQIEFWDGSTWATTTPAPAWSAVTGKPSTFAPAAHNHNASEINAGTLPLTRGGTGGTDAATARTSLGAAAAGHTHAYSDISGKPTEFPPAAHSHVASDISTAEQLKLKVGDSEKANGIKLYVQATAPTGTIPANALWFW